MTYDDKVGALSQDAAKLEQVYHEAVKAGESDAFKDAIDAGYSTAPENLLYAAWFYRLKPGAGRAKAFAVAWAWAIPLALINGLALWLLSDERFTIEIQGVGLRGDYDFLPAVFLMAAPISAVFALSYLTVVGRKDWRLSALIGAVIVAAGAYVLLFYPQTGTRPFQEQYLSLMAVHLPLLAWAGVGGLLIAKHRDPTNRFSFLIKSLEVFIVGGLFLIAWGLFTGITFGLFAALDVQPQESVMRLFIAGGLGVIALVAVAVMYNPSAPPAEQAFDEGLSRLVALLMRALLPLTLLVAIVYLVFIALNFRAPFESREVLIVYNLMLFAVVALLVGATPMSLADLSPGMARWLRRGIIAVAALAIIVGVYALAAILYRTAIDRLTPNRLTFIGWNVINIGLLSLLLLLQLGVKGGRWPQGLYRAYSAGTVAYAAWALAMILAIPWLFGADLKAAEDLPASVQEIVYDQADPILLMCADSPHIYLLERGEKRWIDTIETFEARGYVWREVQFVGCDDLRIVPDGAPIPPDAGPAPQP